jgi:hypothetical protein
MDLFKDFLSNEVDLDDLNTYADELKEMNVHNLFSKCIGRAGTSLFYMNFLNNPLDYGSQETRVKYLCERLSNIWHNFRQVGEVSEDSYRLSLLKWLYRFEDEVENQC